jgi:hydroxyacylglutathione hydrolase
VIGGLMLVSSKTNLRFKQRVTTHSMEHNMYHSTALPAFKDNYIWCIYHDDKPNAVVIDPGSATEVLAFLTEHQLHLAAILITHHHWDHVDGIIALQQRFPQLQLFLPADEHDKIAHLPQHVTLLKAGDQVRINELSLNFHVLAVPGHTIGHLAYVCFEAALEPWLYCGDTLFSAGCGRLFEGTPAQMYHSLQQLLQLPSSTQIFCTHEYTLSNLKFASAVEPDNQSIVEYVQLLSARNKDGFISLPSTLALEQKINPYLRCHLPQLQRQWQQPDAIRLFSFLRQWKNQF